MPLTYTPALQSARATHNTSPRKIVGITLVVLLHVGMFYAFTTGMTVPVILKPADPMVLVEVKSPAQPPKVIPKPEKPETLDKTLTTEPIETTPPVIETVPVIENPPLTSTAPTDSTPVGAADAAITVLRRADPVYPAAARRAGEEGTVVLSVMVDPAGRVSAATVMQSSGSTRLDDAALAAIKRWQFTPRSSGTAQVRVPFSFKLEMK